MSVEGGIEQEPIRPEEEPMDLIPVISHKDLFGPEAEPQPAEVLLTVCEDDAIEAGSNTALIGVVASGEIKLGEGNQDVYPDEDREAMGRVMPVITKVMGDIASDLGISYGETSHPGCGGGNAQAIPADELAVRTKKSVELRGGTYYGHLVVSDRPQPLQEGEKVLAEACITRDESDHHHGASYVFITVGGGVTGDEKQALVERYGSGFQVSADFLKRAIASGTDRKDLAAILTRQDGIAKVIAPEVGVNEKHVVIFNAGRLLEEEAQANIALVRELMN